tara:strand:- start:92 stop:571 length:480 start_codon:yes stop_codon:yes gene_type:complete
VEAAMNINYEEQYYFLKCYLEDNYDVMIRQEAYSTDAWYPLLGLITVNSNLKFRERFFTLVHEAGHAIIDTDVRNRNAICFNKNSPESIRSKRSYVHTLNEEILAWNYGKQLISDLRLAYDIEKFENYMTDCIMSYVKSGLDSIYGKNINIDSINTKYV